MDQEDYLCHHGVKGMKWGRRKQRVSSKNNKAKKGITKSQEKYYSHINIKDNLENNRYNKKDTSRMQKRSNKNLEKADKLLKKYMNVTYSEAQTWSTKKRKALAKEILNRTGDTFYRVYV